MMMMGAAAENQLGGGRRAVAQRPAVFLQNNTAWTEYNYLLRSILQSTKV